MPSSWNIFALAYVEGTSRVAVDLLVILALATLVATIFRRLRLDSIPGFLIAGALVGPHALGFVKSTESVDQISSLATILLMFTIGLHLDVSTLQRGMVHIVGIGVVSTLAVVFVAWGFGLAFGLSAPVALTIALGLSMSSTAVFVRVLSARRESSSAHGRVGLGIAIIQDIAAVVVLALIPPIAKWAGSPSTNPIGPFDTKGGQDGLPNWLEFVSRGLYGLGGVTVMIVVGKFVLPRVIREVSRVGSSELLLVLAGATALAAAIGSAAFGFSPEMGAFLAGLLLAATPYRYQLSGQLVPIRDLLMVVFFTAVGLRVDPRIVAEHWSEITLATTMVLLFKTSLIAFTAWAGGMTAPSAFVTGVYLGNAGEFTLVVLSAAGAAGILSPTLQGICIAIVIAALVVSPSLMGAAHLWSRAFGRIGLSPIVHAVELRDPPKSSQASRELHAAPAQRHVIIAGFGPVGRSLADRFEVRRTPYTVIELNPKTVAKQVGIGRKVVYGDVTNPEVLESAGIHEADAVVLTIPDEDAVLRACQSIRRVSPDVFIAARTNYLSQAFRATQLGADHVTIEEVATAQAMERDVMRSLEARERKRQGKAEILSIDADQLGHA